MAKIFICHNGTPKIKKIAITCAQEISEGVNFNRHKHMKSIMMPRLMALIFFIKPGFIFFFINIKVCPNSNQALAPLVVLKSLPLAPSWP